MEIKYICTYWGCEQLSAKEFLNQVVQNGYTGVEINFPNDANFISEFLLELKNIRKHTHKDFVFIAQQVLSSQSETVDEYTFRLKNRLEFLATLQPDYINSHTGKDYYSFSDNCKIIDTCETISRISGIPIWHEIHRGRFSFHLKTLLSYIDIYPNLTLVADFSLFCVVSESNLQDQHDLLVKIYPNINHIHARIGFEQSPQVNHPFAPEWKNHVTQFVHWWQEIIALQDKKKDATFTITPEFGPFPYMPQEPFTQKPLSNQWEINLEMKKYLQQNL